MRPATKQVAGLVCLVSFGIWSGNSFEINGLEQVFLGRLMPVATPVAENPVPNRFWPNGTKVGHWASVRPQFIPWNAS